MNWFKNLLEKSKSSLRTSDSEFIEELNNFTPRAQQVAALANREAKRLHHDYIGPEHLLLGIIKLNQGVGFQVLRRLHVDLAALGRDLEEAVGIGPEPNPPAELPFLPRLEKVIVFAAKEAQALRHRYVGTEHFLLGILREGDSVAARLLQNCGANTENARLEILKELDPNLGGD